MLRSFPAFLLLFFFSLTNAQKKLLVAVQSERDSVIIFDANSGMKRGQLKVGYLPHEIAYDQVTRRCFISNFGLQDYDTRIGRPGNSISVIDPWTAISKAIIYTCFDTAKGNGPHGLKVRPGNANELYVNVEVGGDSMLVYDLKTYKVKRRFVLPQYAHNFIFSADGNKLWIMAASEGVYEISPENGSVLHHQHFSSPIRGLALGNDWIIASGKNEIFLLSRDDLKMMRHFADLGVSQILYSALTADQQFVLCPAVEDDVVLVIDIKTGSVIHRVAVPKGPIHIEVSNKMAYISHDLDHVISTINLVDFKPSHVYHANGTNGLLLIQ